MPIRVRLPRSSRSGTTRLASLSAPRARSERELKHRKACTVAVLAALAACAPAPSQTPAPTQNTYQRVIAPFTVTNESGEPYAHPFLGGFDVPRPQFIDIDADGDLDLFVQERSNEVMFFENTGTATRATYV